MNGLILNQPIRAQYPLNAFHQAAREAAFELLDNIQAPDALIGMAIIDAMSLACQSLIDVKLPSGKICSVVQYQLCIVESGDGKTTVRNKVLAPFIDHDRTAKEKHELDKKVYESKIEPWKAISKGYQMAIRKAASNGEPTADLEESLSLHIMQKPKKPRLRYYLRQNITQTAIMEAIEGNNESISISSDEGDEQLNGAIMQHPGFLNRLWDSPTVMTHDRSGDQIVAISPRGSVCIYTQWKPFNDYQIKRGSLAKGTGHYARYLVAKPLSMQGHRKVPKNEQTWTRLKLLHDRIKILLDKHQTMIESGNYSREIIEFTEEAKYRWFDLSQQTENLLRKGEYLSDINDHASKLMEILGRLAATMHYFSGEGGKITLDTLNRAFDLIHWHIEEYKILFSPQYAIPQDQIDARDLAVWLRTRIWGGVTSDTFVPKNYVVNRGPIRNNIIRFNAALDLLIEQGGIQVHQSNIPKDRKKYLRLGNAFFSNIIP